MAGGHLGSRMDRTRRRLHVRSPLATQIRCLCFSYQGTFSSGRPLEKAQEALKLPKASNVSFTSNCYVFCQCPSFSDARALHPWRSNAWVFSGACSFASKLVVIKPVRKSVAIHVSRAHFRHSTNKHLTTNFCLTELIEPPCTRLHSTTYRGICSKPQSILHLLLLS